MTNVIHTTHKIEGTGTATKPPLDVAAIRTRAEALPEGETKRDIFTLLAWLESEK